MNINSLDPNEIRSLARDVYVFTCPLVRNYYIMVRRAIDKTSPECAGGFGLLAHTGLIRPGMSSVVSPNNDTPYSYIWLDLRAEPWVLSMPPVEKERYYSAQIDDLWGFVADCPGSVLDGNRGGLYLIAPCDWDGPVPEGVSRVIRSESCFAYCLARTQIFDGESIDDVRKIQVRYKLEPLSSHLGGTAPPPVPMPGWLPFSPGDEKNPDVFRHVNFLLRLVIPHGLDAPMYEKMARLGVGAGLHWDSRQLASGAWHAVQKGIDDALGAMEARFRAASIFSAFFHDRAHMGTRYLDRATGVYRGQFGMPAAQAVYLRWSGDEHGRAIDTSRHAYTVTFPPGGLPGVRYFWSISMYSLPRHDLFNNPLGRCSIGSRTRGLRYGDDGSLTIYINREPPGTEKESNWLPAPDGEASMLVRLYGPDEQAINGDYKLPPVRRA